MTIFEEMREFHGSCIYEMGLSEVRAKFLLHEDKMLTTSWTNIIDFVLNQVAVEGSVNEIRDTFLRLQTLRFFFLHFDFP